MQTRRPTSSACSTTECSTSNASAIARDKEDDRRQPGIAHRRCKLRPESDHGRIVVPAPVGASPARGSGDPESASAEAGPPPLDKTFRPPRLRAEERIVHDNAVAGNGDEHNGHRATRGSIASAARQRRRPEPGCARRREEHEGGQCSQARAGSSVGSQRPDVFASKLGRGSRRSAVGWRQRRDSGGLPARPDADGSRR
jgi:hypothetical protein